MIDLLVIVWNDRLGKFLYIVQFFYWILKKFETFTDS